jgi:uncharacterized protein (TIGR00288 family)
VNIPTTDTHGTRIAVFIDFDNVEIGVKSTIGTQVDIGLILEAIKERGEIVTKVAYSDWKRAGDYSRVLTQHAIRMVQRNMTPGGDKNGADITMALDALEMAFTHDHINAFVIVGGDSDFISLVEKLKQYGRKVIVVGGRQFTSQTMQKNCHEFIAYENLVGAGRGPRQAGRGSRPTSAAANIATVLPLVKRALTVLSEREIAPQLGVLKSTLLQLDSTFSEREYGASSFRAFMEKVAQTGIVTLKQSGRNVLVEPVEERETAVSHSGEVPHEAHEPAVEESARANGSGLSDRHEPSLLPQPDVEDEETAPPQPAQTMEGVRTLQQAFLGGTPRWPMYVRQAKQFLRSAIAGFDERRYGFASLVDLLRAAQKAGVLRIERDRQGVMRLFPGHLLRVTSPQPEVAQSLEEAAVADATLTETTVAAEPVAEAAPEPPIIDAEPLPTDAPVMEEDAKRKTSRKRRTSAVGAVKRAKTPATKGSARPRVARPRAR